MHKILLLIGFYFLSTTLFAQATCDEEFVLVNNAQVIDDCIQLTANSPSQLGCAWFPTLIDFTMPFSHNMTVYFGTTDGNGADGICMVYQANDDAQCGIGGGGVGSVGIPNSFIIEMDTWNNDPVQGDIPTDHISINLNGDNAVPLNGPIDLGNIEDGADHEVGFNWNPVGNAYEVYFDGVLVMSGSYDIVANCFGGNTMVYWGFTSSTGGSSNIHRICPPLPPEVVVDAGDDMELPCPGSSLLLDGTNSDAGAEFEYSWTTFNGNIVSGEDTATPEVDEAGTYILTIVNTITNCEEVDEVTVGENQVIAEIEEPPFLDCFTGVLILDGSGSTSGPNITYEWTTNDGNFSNINDSQAEVDAEGTYTLTVVYDDGTTICTAEESVTVSDDPNVPIAMAEDAVILCDPPTVEIDGSMSSGGGEFEFEWYTFDGSFVNGENSLFPIVDEPGTYYLIVTNVFTGCEDEIEVEVTENRVYPDAFAESNEDLSCINGQVEIDGSLSSQGADFMYTWSTNDGEIVSGENTLTPTVSEVGEYTLVVENIINGCSEQFDIVVMGDFNNPTVEIEDPLIINCLTEEVVLDGSDSDQGANFMYTWTTSDGQLVGPINETTATAGAEGTYILTVLNTDNDCSETAMVTVEQNIQDPTADAGPSEELGCGSSSVMLDGTNSSSFPANQHTYLWTTQDGNIVSGETSLTPTVNSIGTYFIEVTNTLNGCSSIDEVIVDGDDSTPTVNIIVTDTLDCLVSQLVLDASASSQGNDFTWDWGTANGGNILDDSDETQLIVNGAGDYTLEITSLLNNCSSTQTVTVTENLTAPIVSINNPAILNCQTTMVSLDAGASSQGNEFAYQWSTMNGNILNGQNTNMPQINEPGTYQLTILNTQNNCDETMSVTVLQDTISPVVAINMPLQLSCANEQFALNASSSDNGPNFSNNWTTLNGNIVSDTTTLMPTINEQGTYELTITNLTNFCPASAEVTVTEDIVEPTAEAGDSVTINCTNLQQTLGSANTSAGAGFTQLWTTADGQIVSQPDSTFVSVDLDGEYFLTVMNSTNGCSAIDSVTVAANFNTPMITIAMPDTLTCTDTLITLTGSALPLGESYTYNWTTTEGSILSGTTMPEAIVAQSGGYTLSVTNTTSGCSESINTTVLQDENLPTANISMAEELNCVRDTVVLEGMVNVAGGNFDFSWSTQDGNFIANEQTLMPTVNAAGTYILRITDLDNNCNAFAGMEVVLNDTPPEMTIEIPDDLTCLSNQTTLSATNSDSGTNFTYSWSSQDGTILQDGTTLMPLVEGAGDYELLTTNTDNGCTATDTIALGTDGQVPIVIIEEPITLTCTQTTVTLDATASDTTPDFELQWSTVNGTIDNGETTAAPQISGPGIYVLEITNTNNGCTEMDEVEVFQNNTPPTVFAAENGPLTCAEPSISLSATGSDMGPDFMLAWSTNEGNITSANNIAEPTVDGAGAYQILITNTLNGCADSTTVTVLQDTLHPVIDILIPATLTCGVLSVDLDATNSVGGNTPSYQWSTTNGNFTTATDLSTVMVNSSANYTLLLTNLENGCETMETVFVNQDIVAPTINIEVAGILNCEEEELNLDATASDDSGIFTNNWTTAAGNILSGENSLTPLVNTPGSYLLQITNTENECFSIDSLMVTQDTISPVIDILMPDTLSCNAESIFIDANGSDFGADFTINWTSANGNIIGGSNSLTPEVDALGDYQLEIINTINGCSNQQAVSVAQDADVPLVQIEDAEELTCLLQAFSLNATNSDSGNEFQITWTTANGQIQEGENTLEPVITAPGVYELTILNTTNDCDDVVSIEVFQDTEDPIADAGDDFVLDCFTPSSLLDGTASSQGGEITYQWTALAGEIISDPQSTQPTINDAGLFGLLVTDTGNGCTAEDQVEVEVDIPQGTAQSIDPLCYGESGVITIDNVLGGTSPYVYSVNAGVSFQSAMFFGNLSAGVYTIIVQDANGCEYEEEVTITQPDSLVVTITQPEVVLKWGETHQVFTQLNIEEEQATYINWEQNGTLSCGDCLHPLASPLETSIYRITVQDENGCEDQSLLRIIVEKDRDVYIPSGFSPNGDGINDFAMIFARPGIVTEIRSFELYNRWGEAVHTIYNFQPNDATFGWDGDFRGQPMNPAVFTYAVEIEFIDGSVEIFEGDITLVR